MTTVAHAHRVDSTGPTAECGGDGWYYPLPGINSKKCTALTRKLAKYGVPVWCHTEVRDEVYGPGWLAVLLEVLLIGRHPETLVANVCHMLGGDGRAAIESTYRLGGRAAAEQFARDRLIGFYPSRSMKLARRPRTR